MPSPGSLDTTFGVGGLVTTNFDSSGNDDIYALLLQPADQKLVGVGRTVAARSSFALARYNPDGSLDTTGFNPGGPIPGTVVTLISANGNAYGGAIQANGKIIAAGWSGASFVSGAQFTVARYNSDGSLDTAGFGSPNGYVRTAIGATADVAWGVAIASSQKIVVAGRVSHGIGLYDVAVARYNSDGTLDTSGFNPGGAVPGVKTLHVTGNDQALCVALQADGKIVVAGLTSNDILIARFNTNGSLDTGFGSPNGYVDIPVDNGCAANGIAIQADGKIVVAGYAYDGSFKQYIVTVRVNADGSLDTGFGTGGIASTSFGTSGDFAQCVAVQSNGKIVVGGSTDTNNGLNNRFALVCLNADGTPDSSFGTGGLVSTLFTGTGGDAADSVVIQADGKIVLGGLANNVATADNFGLARYAADLSSGGGSSTGRRPRQRHAVAVPPSSPYSSSVRDGGRRQPPRITHQRPNLRLMRHVVTAPVEPEVSTVRRRRVGGGMPTTYPVVLTAQVLWEGAGSTSVVGSASTVPLQPQGSPYAYVSVPAESPVLTRGPTADPARCLPSPEFPFRRLVIDYLVAGGARISWELSPYLTDPSPWTYQLQYAQSAIAGADWTNIGPPVTNTWFLLDDQKRLYGRTADLAYRVILTTGTNAYLSEPAQVWGRLGKRDWLIARETLRGFKLKHRFSAIPGFLLKARRSGVPCSICIDPCSGQCTNADCPVCFGTRWMGGYYRAVECLFCRDGNENSREHLAELATTKVTTNRGNFVGAPLLVQEDVWVERGSDRRYQIHDVDEAAVWRGVPLMYIASRSPLPYTNIAYQVPLG